MFFDTASCVGPSTCKRCGFKKGNKIDWPTPPFIKSMILAAEEIKEKEKFSNMMDFATVNFKTINQYERAAF